MCPLPSRNARFGRRQRLINRYLWYGVEVREIHTILWECKEGQANQSWPGMCLSPSSLKTRDCGKSLLANTWGAPQRTSTEARGDAKEWHMQRWGCSFRAHGDGCFFLSRHLERDTQRELPQLKVIHGVGKKKIPFQAAFSCAVSIYGKHLFAHGLCHLAVLGRSPQKWVSFWVGIVYRDAQPWWRAAAAAVWHHHHGTRSSSCPGPFI